MKLPIATLAAAILLAGCQALLPAATTPTCDKFKYGTGDGQTMATAVEIRTRSETEGGVLVRDWIKAKYPGYRIQYQELIEHRGRAYSQVTIVGSSGTPRRLYFDISSYYRPMGNENFPKPLP